MLLDQVHALCYFRNIPAGRRSTWAMSLLAHRFSICQLPCRNQSLTTVPFHEASLSHLNNILILGRADSEFQVFPLQAVWFDFAVCQHHLVASCKWWSRAWWQTAWQLCQARIGFACLDWSGLQSKNSRMPMSFFFCACRQSWFFHKVKSHLQWWKQRNI